MSESQVFMDKLEAVEGCSNSCVMKHSP